MNESQTRLDELKGLIDGLAEDEGVNQTAIENLFTFRGSEPHGRQPNLYEPALILAVQGRKQVYLEGRRFEYGAGQFFALFMPMAFECELLGVSPGEPMLGMAIRLDRHRIARLLLKMEQLQPGREAVNVDSHSAVFSAPIGDRLLDAATRLLRSLHDPLEAQVLGESIIDEIYYRVICDERGGALKALLHQQGQIQQISRAVEYLHEHLERNVPIDDLASVVNMSVSGFHKKFKEVMHLSPLQYIKLIRLNKARVLLLEGQGVSEAGYQVGYNSSAQFSREFKRQFGMAPSAAV